MGLEGRLGCLPCCCSMTPELRLASYEDSRGSVPSSLSCGSLARKSRLVSVNVHEDDVEKSLTSR